MILAAYGDEISARLRAQGLLHLNVLKRGQHLVVYSVEPDGSKVNRVRFSWAHGQTFGLGVADRNGRWANTGEIGSIEDLVTTLLNQFPFVLSDW
jgi:hypothetical protein